MVNLLIVEQNPKIQAHSLAQPHFVQYHGQHLLISNRNIGAERINFCVFRSKHSSVHWRSFCNLPLSCNARSKALYMDSCAHIFDLAFHGFLKLVFCCRWFASQGPIFSVLLHGDQHYDAFDDNLCSFRKEAHPENNYGSVIWILGNNIDLLNAWPSRAWDNPQLFYSI